ncbi:tautomerase family protein [Trinickia mobilis]|uniref:tautomerase family protein n=1 Tax=Trinickia mobilis TaxID=2816356 RepID=UPI001A8FDBDF|nr:tautomerase family protein [Trinickia mobilis]
MPIIVCNTRAGLDVDAKRRIAKEITSAVHETIKSPLNIISVVFNDLAAESSYVGGKPGGDTLIMCNIRSGRSEEAKISLVKKISAIFSECTGISEEKIETGLLEYVPKYIIRGGKELPDPPYA